MAKSFGYIKVHESMPDHPKVDPLSDAAFRLLVSSWCWCRKHETDGTMPLAVWRKRRTPKVRAELVTQGLVVEHVDRVTFHDYLEWQKSADELEAAREQRRTAGQAGGLARSKRLAKQTASDSLSEIQAEVEVEKEQKTSSSVAAAEVITAARILGEFVEHCGPQPRAVKQKLGEQISLLLSDGIDERQVKAGLKAWVRRPDAAPGLLPHLVPKKSTELAPGKEWLREVQ